MFGYMGKILKVDLANRKFETQDLPSDYCKKFLGGRGFGARLLYENIGKEVEPFSNENILTFSAGPLTGTLSTGSKMSVGTKSPATEGYADSHIGGHIGPAFRATGHDIMILEKKADKPVYLEVSETGIKFFDASDLWGKGTFETENILLKRYNKEVHIMAIGPAGEKRVRFACISHDFGRQAGRCGVGAVMGDKNVKAIVCIPTKSITIHNPEKFLETSIKVKNDILSNPATKDWTRLGTALHVEHGQDVSCFPTNNHRYGVHDHYLEIGSETMYKDFTVKNKACYACALMCGKYSHVKSGPYKGTKIDGPEYEIIALMGSNCGMNNLGVICKGNYLADDIGLDAISLGNVVAFTMECYEKGALSEKDLGGPANFGNEDAYLRIIDMIGYRKGVGDILAEGVKRAADKIGKDTYKFAMHSKGLEQSGYETRSGQTQAVGYSINDRGADHNRIWNPLWFEDGEVTKNLNKGESIKLVQCRRSASDIMGTCRFISYFVDFNDYGKLITYLTGNEIDGDGILLTAERIYNMTRVFNYRHGFTKESDYIPPRVYEEPIERGPKKGLKISKEELEKTRDEFYLASGWDLDGLPSHDKLVALDLKDVAEEAKKYRK